MFDFTPFGIISVAFIIAAIISSKLKVPLTVLLILVGMIFGPGLKLIKENEIIDAFAEIGSIFLLFLIGLEFNLEKIKNISLPAALVFITEFMML
ncbi:MAG: cation:proton antiporter, partial [Candidatus Aenigmatarchaeota archaeon]